MATTKIVLLSDSTAGWFFNPPTPQAFFPEALYDRYGRTIRTANNAAFGGSYSALTTRWFGGGGADEIHLYDAAVGGSNWDDITAQELQVRVTDVSPDRVLIAYGINGGAVEAGDGTLQAGLEGLYDDVAAAVPTATIVFASQNPLNKDTPGDPVYRDAVEAAATTKSALFIDVYQAFIDYGDWQSLVPDNTHPNDEGKQLYADTVEPALFNAGLLGAAQGGSTVAVLDTAEVVLRANRYSGSGDWLDESGNGHHATPVNNPTWDGEKFTLDGATHYFTIPDDPALDVGVGEDLTVVAVATVAADVAANGRIVSKRAVPNGGWEFYYQHAPDDSAVYLSDGVDTVVSSTPDGTILQGTRQVFSYRVDRASDVLRIGLDGTYTQSGSIAAIGDASTSIAVEIGRLTNNTNFLKGDIYGVALFRSVLSDQDIEQAGQELTAVPSAPSNRMGGTGAIRRKGGPRP